MNLQKQAAQGVKWQALEIVGRQLLSLAVFTTLARLLTPGDFGLVGIVVTYLAFVSILAEQGIGSALIQRPQLEDGHVNAAFWFNLSAATILCVLTMIAAGAIARAAGDLRLAPLLRLASGTLVVNALSAVQSTLFVRELEFRQPMQRTLIANAAGGGVGIAMAVNGYGVWSLIAQQLTSAVAGTGFVWVVSPWRPTFHFSMAHLRDLMRVSGAVFTTSLLWAFASRIDQLAIGGYLGAAALGQYVVGAKFVDLARAVIHQPIAGVSMPAMAKVQRDHARLCSVIYRAMDLNALISFAVFGGLAAVASTLVPVAFGEQWRPAGSLLQRISLYGLALGLSVFVHPALLASGGPGRYVLVSGFCALGSGLACVLGIRWGVQAVVLLMTANIAGCGILALLFLRVRIGLQPARFVESCVVPMVATGAMYVTVTLLRSWVLFHLPALASLLLQVVVGAAAYCSIVFALAPSTISALRQLIVEAFSARGAGQPLSKAEALGEPR